MIRLVGDFTRILTDSGCFKNKILESTFTNSDDFGRFKLIENILKNTDQKNPVFTKELLESLQDCIRKNPKSFKLASYMVKFNDLKKDFVQQKDFEELCDALPLSEENLCQAIDAGVFQDYKQEMPELQATQVYDNVAVQVEKNKPIYVLAIKDYAQEEHPIIIYNENPFVMINGGLEILDVSISDDELQLSKIIQTCENCPENVNQSVFTIPGGEKITVDFRNDYVIYKSQCWTKKELDELISLKSPVLDICRNLLSNKDNIMEITDFVCKFVVDFEGNLLHGECARLNNSRVYGTIRFNKSLYHITMSLNEFVDYCKDYFDFDVCDVLRNGFMNLINADDAFLDANYKQPEATKHNEFTPQEKFIIDNYGMGAYHKVKQVLDEYKKNNNI